MAALNFSKFNISVQVGYGAAKAHGFKGTPEDWEKAKHDYATHMLDQFGEDHRIDFNNLLISHDNWFDFPPENQQNF